MLSSRFYLLNLIILTLLCQNSFGSTPILADNCTTNIEMTNLSSAVTFPLSAFEENNETLTWSIKTDPLNGSLALSGSSTGNMVKFIYTPTGTLQGEDAAVVTVTNSSAESMDIPVILNRFIVRTMPSYSHKKLYGNALLNKSLAVWGNVRGGTPPYSYTLDFGDGSTAATGTNISAADGFYLGADHSYTNSGLKLITLTVTDADGSEKISQSTLRVYATANQQIEINTAIEKGLLYLYRNAERTIIPGQIYWPISSSYYQAGSTGLALLAFEENGHFLRQDETVYAYNDLVRNGLKYILDTSTGDIATSNHSDGISVRDTDANDNNKGAAFFKHDHHDMYTNACLSLPFFMSCKSMSEAKRTFVTDGPFAGRSFYDVGVDAADLMMWSQSDGTNRGGWYYHITESSGSRDGSAMQWPVLLLKMAEDRWGINTPQWVKDNTVDAFEYLQGADGSIGYTSPNASQNSGKTG
ncbi:MAG: PKD domain-containing protein, partial [Lentisphaeria bacterium]|nr:PKD domain-containing protein [Lentisphaeria bacterium]